MSSEESQNSTNYAENSTKSDSGSDSDTSTSGSMRYVASHSSHTTMNLWQNRAKMQT